MVELLLLHLAFGSIEIDEITVVARRRDRLLDVPVAVSAVAPVADAGFVHPNQIFDGVPGAWVSRGSGQEHLTAIRSPVLTGAGACGAFLLLDDGIPIRPPGFCNVNNLFELNLAQAGRVEVLRGPAPAHYGSNGLHGVINVVPGPPQVSDSPHAALWWGPDDYRRILGSYSAGVAGGALRLDANGISSGSFRAGEGFDQQQANLNWAGEVRSRPATVSFSATNLNQETAGFIFGPDAYRDAVLRTGNVNPEAFRDAWSARLSASVQLESAAWQHQVRPFARSSRMTFLQHFLPGQPLESNGQDSLGMQWLASRDWAGGLLQVGADVDLADGTLREFQAGPTTGSAFLVETRPPGLHYDFSVDAVTFALFSQYERQLGQDWTAHLGLRAERSSYRYDNRASDGNLRDDGSACGFGGCLYNRPADRRDQFTDWAPKLALTRTIGATDALYVRASRGFRAPQATELYRLQSNQSVAQLDSEKVDSVEAVWRRLGSRGSLQVAAWYLSKRNFIFRDADGFNVSDGRTRHRGLEWDVALNIGKTWRLEQTGAYALQHYAFSRDAGGGEIIRLGNEVDTAPRAIVRTRLGARSGAFDGALEWVHQGSYFTDAANAHAYPGHDLLHLQLARRWRDWRLQLRLENIANRRYAERADFAFGNERYFPGAGRQLFVGLSWRPSGES